MHVSLPRKWRPKRFADLIGQEAVAQTLTHAISENRVAPAYLLTGPRGVGKTSTARLLARALNCEKGPTPDPCGQCASCREILEKGDSLDVHEIDGASNRKIENARELIETVRYAPQRDRFRIAVIDEVHMLTTEAFNALLKTLEEPPPHARFILASTELHKIPATIVSRCQRFRFKALTVSAISEHLARVAEAEKIAVTPEALRILAVAAEGSLRDALSLLDQASTLADGVVDEARCAEILALVDRELLEAAYSAAASGDRGAAVSVLARLAEKGSDPRHVFKELLSLLRTLLVTSAGGDPEVAPESRERLAALARAMSYENLLRALSLTVEAEALARRADDAGLVLQLHLLRLAELPRLARIEDLLASGTLPAGRRAGRPAEPSFCALGAADPVSRDGRAGARPAGRDGRRRRRCAGGSNASTRSSTRAGAWPRPRSAWPSRSRCRARTSSCASASTRPRRRRRSRSPRSRKLLSDVAREAFGRALRVVLKTGPPTDGDLGKAAREVPRATIARERASSRAETDPVVRSALELFRGELTEVKEEE